jgi:hypothetical protein
MFNSLIKSEDTAFCAYLKNILVIKFKYDSWKNKPFETLIIPINIAF